MPAPEGGYLSINEWASDGSRTEYELSFAGGFLSRDHVELVVYAPSGDAAMGYTFTWLSNSQVSLSHAPPAGYLVRWERNTPYDLPVHEFSSGALLTEATLDDNARQPIMLAAELRDRFGSMPEIDGIAVSVARAEAAAASAEDAASGWVPAVAKTAVAFNAAAYGIIADNSTDNAAALNDLIATVAAAGGGDIHLPSGTIRCSATIDIKYPRVRLVGAGAATFHDAGVSTARTIFKPTFAGTAMKIRTPYAAEQGVAVGNTSKFNGAGAVGIEFNGGGLATCALEIDSVSLIEVDVYATGFVGTTVYSVKCGVTGTDLGEACDVQFSRMNFRARQIDTVAERASHILTLDGSSNTDANVSLNRGPLYGISVYAQHWDGDVLRGLCADNNDISVVGVRAGGTGRLFYGRGPTAAKPQAFSSNAIVYASGTGAIVQEGTDTAGVTGGVWNSIVYDSGNGTPIPTAGTGSRWTSQRTSFGERGDEDLMSVVVADSITNARAARTAKGTESLRISNSSNNHIKIADGVGNEWGVSIEGANGNLRFNRIAGTGEVVLGGGTPVSVNGLLTAGSFIKLANYTVAALGPPAPVAYCRAFVTDATSTTFNSVAVGGGANKVPVWSDGSNWRIG